MSITHTVACDAIGCGHTAPVLGGPTAYSDTGLNARGWIVDRRTQRSALTGQHYEAVHHFCSSDCLRAWHDAWVANHRKELIRR